MITRKSALLAPVLLLTSLSAATAAPLTAQNILDQFNVVIFGNFTSNSDVEGRSAIGQTMTGGATFMNNPNNTAASTYGALTVFGGVTGAGYYNLNNAGGLAVGGANAGNFNLNGGTYAYIAGNNTGGLSGNAAAMTIGGSNTANLSAGGAVFVGAANDGSINAGNNNGVTINGNNNIGGTNGSIQANNGVIVINGNTGNVSMSGGTLIYSGTQNGNVNLNGGALAIPAASVNVTVPANPLGSFTNIFQTPLTTLSSTIAGLAPDGRSSATYNAGNNTVTINAVPDANGNAVLSLSTALFQQNANVNVNLNGATSVMVNVTVAACPTSTCSYSFDSSVHFNNPTSYADSVVWNFPNATQLNFNTLFGGAVIAPLAVVTNITPIDGTLVAASFVGSGELHSYAFTGTLPSAFLVTGANNVSEPSTLAVLGLGILGLGMLRRTRAGSAAGMPMPV